MQSNMILETKKGKTSSVWLECLIFALLYIIFEIIIGMIVLVLIVVDIIRTDVLEITEELTSLETLVMLFSCAIIIFGVIFYCRKLRKRSYASMGIVRKGAAKNYLIGVSLGAVQLLVVYAVMFICGFIEDISYGGYSNVIFLFLLGFIIQSASEELMFRGYLMNSIAARSNIPLAVIINSVIFMALHLLNPGANIIGMIDIAIIGIVYSLLFLLTENIWVVSGMHFFWNFASGCLLGSNVSGMEMNSLFNITLTENELFSGGEFGIEGSIVTALVDVLFVIILIMIITKRNSTPQYQEKMP